MDPELNRHIYDAEFREWLPDTVLDVHIHLSRRDSYPDGFEPPPKSYHRFLKDQSYPIEDCVQDAETMLPDKTFLGLCFGSPGPEVDRDRANRYIASVVDNRRFFGLAMVSPQDPMARVERWMRETPLLGYKPYRDFFTGQPRETVSIPNMLPDRQMELADKLGLVVMLHVPRAKRLADPDNQREVCALADRYPNTSIILAHVGRAYYLRSVVGHLAEVRKRPNIYVDLAMLNHWEVIEHVFQEFPRDRILFGTDMPISCFGGKSVEINDQYAYIMESDIEIGAAIHDAGRAVQFTYFYYEELRAIRKAALKAALTREELRGVFVDNSLTLLSRAVQSKGQ